MFCYSVFEKELEWVNVALGSHQNFINSHRHFYLTIIGVVRARTFWLSTDFWRFGKADGERFWVRSFWDHRRTLISLAICIQVCLETFDSLSGINSRHKVEKDWDRRQLIRNRSQIILNSICPVKPVTSLRWKTSNCSKTSGIDFRIYDICLVLIFFLLIT